MTEDRIRSAFAGFPSGVGAVCAEIDGDPVGMVATSFSMGASFSPPLLVFAVQAASTTWPVLRRAGRLGVTVLSSGHSRECLQLASRTADRFAGLDYDVTEEGAITIRDSAMWFDCSLVSETPIGDHRLIVLEVHDLSIRSDIEPLVYHARSFWGLQPAG